MDRIQLTLNGVDLRIRENTAVNRDVLQIKYKLFLERPITIEEDVRQNVPLTICSRTELSAVQGPWSN